MAKKGEPNPLKGGTLHTIATERSNPYNHAGIDTFFRLVRQGNFLCTAADLSGIPRNRLISWRKAGKEGKEPYASFLLELNAARAEHESGLLQRIQDSDDPKMQLAILERRYHRWAKVQKILKDADVQITEFLDQLMTALDDHPEAKEIVIAFAENYDTSDENLGE